MPNMRNLISQFLFFICTLLIATGSAALLFGHGPGRAAPPIAPDKVAHASVSASLGMAARLRINDPWKAWSLAMLPGLAKEVYDARPGGSGFSVGDLVADGVGAYLGVQFAGLSIGRNRITYRREF